MFRLIFKLLYLASGMLALLLIFDAGRSLLRAEEGRAKEGAPGKVTVIALITPQMADGSSWDIGFGADLVLCGEAGCYVSQGLGKPAQFYEGSSGLRLLKKAGACRDQVRCVFRGVDPALLKGAGPGYFQLVDVDYVAHTYLDKVPFERAMNCALSGAALACEPGVHHQTFSLWVIDEALADKSGRGGLDQALFKGLVQQRHDHMIAGLASLRPSVRESAARFYKLVLEREVPSSCLDKTAFLTETFFIAGLADPVQRRTEPLIQRFLGAPESLETKELIQRTPELYWAFVDIAGQLKAFSRAQSAHLVEDEVGLTLKDDPNDKTGAGRLVLSYGWRLEARAKTLLEGCAELKAALPLVAP